MERDRHSVITVKTLKDIIDINKTDNVRVNVTLRRVRATIVRGLEL